MILVSRNIRHVRTFEGVRGSLGRGIKYNNYHAYIRYFEHEHTASQVAL